MSIENFFEVSTVGLILGFCLMTIVSFISYFISVMSNFLKRL